MGKPPREHRTNRKWRRMRWHDPAAVGELVSAILNKRFHTPWDVMHELGYRADPVRNGNDFLSHFMRYHNTVGVFKATPRMTVNFTGSADMDATTVAYRGELMPLREAAARFVRVDCASLDGRVRRSPRAAVERVASELVWNPFAMGGDDIVTFTL